MPTPFRSAILALIFIDEYCQYYQPLSTDVRSYEAFKDGHMGMSFEIQRKILTAIPQVCVKWPPSIEQC